jgi:peroxiredoxin
MSVKVGDRLPNATFRVMTAEGPKPKTTDEVFKGKKVVLFAVPGAFTPTCHTIAVTGVNDVFVMDVWKKMSNADAIEFLSDGSAEFAKAIGLDLDASGLGLGIRSKRYAMIVEDGVVKALNVEDVPSKADISNAENILKAL